MLIFDEEEARVVRRIYDWYLEGYSIGGIIDKLAEKKIKTAKGKERWSKRAIESTLTREKYTGDVAIADSGGSDNRYLNKNHHEGIIFKEQFKAVQLEMELRSNVEIGEDCFIIAQVGIAGSTKIGDSCVLAGQTGITGHVNITDHVVLGGKTGVVGNIETPGTYVGYPARPHGEWGREQIMVTRLPELMKKMRRLEKLLTEKGIKL